MNLALVFFILIGFVYIHQEITNWQGFAENLRYIINGLPLAIILLFLAIKNSKDYNSLSKKEKLLNLIAFIISGLLFIPPYFIYLYLY